MKKLRVGWWLGAGLGALLVLPWGVRPVVKRMFADDAPPVYTTRVVFTRVRRLPVRVPLRDGGYRRGTRYTAEDVGGRVYQTYDDAIGQTMKPGKPQSYRCIGGDGELIELVGVLPDISQHYRSGLA